MASTSIVLAQKRPTNYKPREQYITYLISCERCQVEVNDPTKDEPNRTRKFYMGANWFTFTFKNTDYKLDSVTAIISTDRRLQQQVSVKIEEFGKVNQDNFISKSKVISTAQGKPNQLIVGLKLISTKP